MAERRTRTVKKHSAFCWKDLARAERDGEALAFANEVLYRARALSVPCGGRTLWLALRAPDANGEREEACLHLGVGSHSLRVGIGQLSELVLLDQRLPALVLEVYEESLQKLLVEALVEPLLAALGQGLGEPVALEKVEIATRVPQKLPPFAVHFAIYAANPHAGEAVPRLLTGSAAMDKKLAALLLEKIKKVPPARYRTYAAAVPRCSLVLASMAMALEELASLAAGDVIFLAGGDGAERVLQGIGPYAIDCAQDGNKMTVKAIRTL
ncbi:MAG: hypothetical protein LBT98_00605 [Puniceicoccales bacterium]|nr:hypothetical protein [Puniceicoccales bacterium]